MSIIILRRYQILYMVGMQRDKDADDSLKVPRSMDTARIDLLIVDNYKSAGLGENAGLLQYIKNGRTDDLANRNIT